VSLCCIKPTLTINVEKYQRYVNRYYPNDTTQTEWDVLHAICATIHIMPIHPSINHIKGHQDRQTPISELPLPAQLNVEADQLAEQYMQYHHDNHRRALMFPDTKILLHGPDGTITHNMKRELILLKCGEKALLHITKTNGWLPNTKDLVDWNLHSQVLQKMPHYTI
jgi:hypothetical protein